MTLIVKDTGGTDFEPIPEDQHIARCVLLADVGTQKTPFGTKRQAIIGWEVPGVQRVFDEARGEEPAFISAFYTASLADKANLRRVLESWRGRAFTAEELTGFDLETILGAPCLLQIIHKQTADHTRAHVQGVSKLPTGLDCPTQHCPSRTFSFASPSRPQFDAMPEWIQKQIMAAAEWQALQRQQPAGTQANDFDAITATEPFSGDGVAKADETPF
ncbi:MAG: hypothetical protein GY903_17145 [Fuerstiella sp.]|nr:hypothetical protein [Fuerstiella sp.]MCP4856210.1 hypothetical protein [Fuerstiella sp.]